MIGETIKGFKVTGRLGKGGMGEVWVAEQPIVKTQVAIKLLLANLSTDQQLVQRFFNEAIAVSKIKHAGIVKIHDVGFHHAAAFLIMELLEGESLAARIRRIGRLPIGQVADIGRQMSGVLQATHAAGITHRDLKPDNIFLVQDAELASGERVKILDFGIAKLGTGVGMTGSGGTMGTPGYMAPEQWTDAASADSRADVYAVGCIAFEMCCGRPPFVVSTIPEAYAKHVHEVPPRARTMVADVPRDLDEMIAAALAKRAADRPSMKELERVFAAMTVAQPPGASAEQRAGREPASTVLGVPREEPDTTLRAAALSMRQQPRRRRRWHFLAVGGIVLAGLSVGGYSITQRRQAPLPAPYPGAPREPERPVTSDAPPQLPLANAWVRIVVPTKPTLLGIDDDGAPATVRGFRPARKITSPATAYELQEHEVTWSEIEPWLASSGTSLAFPTWAKDPAMRAALPVTGVTWEVAQKYCRSLGGSLPSEEQWEYAARGAERRPNSWGTDRLDRSLTRAYAGPEAIPAAVKSSLQDQTPAPAIFDLIGNVQEWTLGLWREDLLGADEAWALSGPTSIRAIRGLPLGAEPPSSMPVHGAAYRDQRCATGPCVNKGADLRRYVGFRCARPASR